MERRSSALSVINGDRKISRARRVSRKRQEDVKELMSKFAKDCGFDLAENQLVDLVDAVKEYAKRDQAGGLFIERELGKKTSVTVNMSRKTSLAAGKVKQDKPKTSCCSCSWFSYQRLVKNSNLAICFLVYALVNLAFMAYRAVQYYNAGPIMMFGRACAASLYINITLSALCILRRTISALRKTFLVNFLPFDHHISIHKFLGKMIFFLSIIHTVAHILRYAQSDDFAIWECLFTTRMEEGWVLHLAGITGVVLLLLMFVIMLFSLSYFRRNGYFELFYWVHHVSIAWWLVMIIHAPDFWMWFLVPSLLYLYEFVSRVSTMCRRQDSFLTIEDYQLLPSKVTQLKIRRPESFLFSPGDYVFVKIPSIAKHEWHPFTISSAPEETEFITLHIRSLGNWTAKLHTMLTFIDYCHLVSEAPTMKDFRAFHSTRRNDVQEFQKFMSLQRSMSNADTIKLDCITEERTNKADDVVEEAEEEGESLGIDNKGLSVPSLELQVEDMLHAEDARPQRTRKYHSPMSYDQSDYVVSINVPPPPMMPRKGTLLEMGGLPNPDISKVYVEGPYGSPSSDIFNAKHAILIAAGIGVTPFASILQSIMHRYRRSKSVCPECQHEWVRDLPSFLKLRKVDFIWINRDVKAFEWFLSILSALEEEQHTINNNGATFLDFHLFVKGVFAQKGNEQAAGLKVALDLSYEKYNKDILTGLKTKLHTGAPDWDKLFSPYKHHTFGKPKIFFCGPSALGKVLTKKAFEYKFDFKKENF